MPSPNVQAILVSRGVERFDQIVQIREWLAHAHDNNVGQSTVGRRQISQPDELFEDFPGRQIPHHAIEAARTENAAHAAAHLCADAGCPSRWFLNQDAFNHASVVKLQEKLVRVVRRLEMALDPCAERCKARRKLTAKRNWQIGHSLKSLGSAGEDLTADLPAAHRQLATRREPRMERFFGLVEKRRPIDRVGQGMQFHTPIVTETGKETAVQRPSKPKWRIGRLQSTIECINQEHGHRGRI
jgi:hypothetical protein